MVMIRTLIVDDEPLARKKIRTFLKPHTDFEIIGECVDGQEAADAILRLHPDALFLDVRIPQIDGFQLLERFDPNLVPQVVFVTAHDEYAVRAFDAHALDYLLKPFNRRRFEVAINRIRTQLHQKRHSPKSRFVDWVRQAVGPQGQAERIVVRTNGKILLLPTSRIEWIEAQGDYVLLHAGKENYLSRDTMLSLESKLNPRKFVRIHRSTIVNLDFVDEFTPIWSGDYRVSLRDGKELTLSRAFRHRLPAIRQHRQG